MTGPVDQGFMDWVKDRTRPSANATPDVHDISRFTMIPRTDDNRRAILKLASWRKDHPAEQPRRKSPLKRIFTRASLSKRTARITRSHLTPSPEQEMASTPRPYSWASRGTRDFVGGATPSVQSEINIIFELGDLIKCQTASPVYTLQRLAKLETALKSNDAHRKHLLGTAKLAVQVAYSEFNRARHAARQRTSKGGGEASDPAPTIHLADIRDLRTSTSRCS